MRKKFEKLHKTDICVIGGLAGTFCAISAARCGSPAIMIQFPQG